MSAFKRYDKESAFFLNAFSMFSKLAFNSCRSVLLLYLKLYSVLSDTPKFCNSTFNRLISLKNTIVVNKHNDSQINVHILTTELIMLTNNVHIKFLTFNFLDILADENESFQSQKIQSLLAMFLQNLFLRRLHISYKYLDSNSFLIY